MTAPISNNQPNTFTQQQWDQQLPTANANGTPQVSTTFSNQLVKTQGDLDTLKKDSLALANTQDTAAYAQAYHQLAQDYHAFHQDQIQLINTAKSDGSPQELGQANDLGHQALSVINDAPKAPGTLPNESIADYNAINADSSDIEKAGTYQINGTSYNNAPQGYDSQGHHYLDPNDGVLK